jgi:aminopeptidase N
MLHSGLPMRCSKPEPSPGRIQRSAWLAALVMLACGFQARAAEITERLPARLPTDVTPVHYDIHLEPNAAELTFQGRETIDIVVQRETASIVLNALDLDVRDATLDDGTKAEVTLDVAAHTLTLAFKDPIAPGPHRLALAFSGRIGTNPAGLFAVDYSTDDGPRRMLSMQLEPADGRRVAPMWDEPAAKATFTLEVIVPKDLVAFSNMPEAANRVVGDARHVRFQTTPRMSSYLLHLSVGDLERVSRIIEGVDVGIVMRKGAGSMGAFALDAAAAILPWFNDYFGTPYPLPKLDMIAAPGQSTFFGAMENWGAILYFETALLVDPARSSQSDRQAIFEVIAHEVAHQWFGNLVTMRWWDDLWLNEGFASWMASKVTSELHPEWKPWLQAVANSREAAMQLDAGAATHPVVQRVESVDAVQMAFDAIAYNKGEAVIRMIEQAVGETDFRAGIRSYMRKHAYSNTVTDDLWRELESASGQPITAIAHDFTLQPGVPLVTVESAECSAGMTRLTLTQSRFETDGRSAERVAWRIPIHARSIDGESDARLVMEKDGPATLSVRGCGPVVVNAGQSGYFRTLYPPLQLARLRSNFARVQPIDQLGMLSDASALGNVTLVPATSYLDLSSYVPVDGDPVVWSLVAGKLAAIDRVFDGSPEQADWRKLARSRIEPQFGRVGWTAARGQQDASAILRENLIASLGVLDDEQVIAAATDRFERDVSDPGALPAAIRQPALDVTARHASVATWEKILARARAETNPVEKQRMYVRLGGALDPVLARRALDLALGGEPPVTTSPAVIEEVSALHPELAFDFAIANEGKVLALVEPSSRYSFIPGLARSSADAALAGRLREYMLHSIPETARQDANESIAVILRRARSFAYNRPEYEAWVKARTSGGCKACRASAQ